MHTHAMFRSKITRQQLANADVFGCFNNLFRLLQLDKIYKHFVPFIKTQNIYLTLNNANN